MTSRTFYITTPIYYVNDLPHIGHIYTTVVADVVARYQRMRGREVRFLTGTDEHGQKIVKAALAQGITPEELANRVVRRYPPLWQALGITNDDFIRTTEPRHWAGVHEMIRRMEARGDIYKGNYGGWYCAGCEAFFPQTQLVEGKCPEQGHPVEWLEEESYFFRLSAYQQPLLRFYSDHPDFIRPESRYNEVVRFVEGGLKDLSVSRVSLPWGIPWPGDPRHVVYVWLDALTNYISALGFGSQDPSLFERFWPADLHLVGKDILRFHCVYWPAFLLSAGLPLPRQVYGHGWWLRDDKKMSKSFGNVVRPDHLLERFGADPLRYFMLREMTFGQDASFSDEGFLQRYNADLANGLGNAAARVLAMTRRYYSGTTPPVRCGANVLADKSGEVVARYVACMDSLEFHRALEAVWELVSAVDGYVNEKQPWAIFKLEGGSSERLGRVLYNSLEALRLAAAMLAPVMPTTSRRLLAQMGIAPESRAAVALSWGELPTLAPLGEEGALFPRVDVQEFLAEVTVNETSEPGGQSVAPPPAAPAGAAEEQISIEEFARVKLVVGLITAAERIPKSKKLVRMQVDLGEGKQRQIVAGIGTRYAPEQLVGRRAVFVANLKPAVLMGVESQGMVLAASVEGDPFLLGVDGEVPPGTGVK
ncbi:MAG: methionine--tRNA ligase [Thermoanaerobaculaceae bacterium]|nr:methionine--tRNA ligase [Thermoanaerobaculaceae bacterium]